MLNPTKQQQVLAFSKPYQQQLPLLQSKRSKDYQKQPPFHQCQYSTVATKQQESYTNKQVQNQNENQNKDYNQHQECYKTNESLQLRQKQKHISSVGMSMKSSSCKQIDIYNRYFYLGNAHKSLLQSQYEQELKLRANAPKVKPASYQILSEKLERNLTQVINRTTKDHLPNQQAFVSYGEMSSIILEMNPFLKKAYQLCQQKLEHLMSQIWIYLNHYDIESEQLSKDTLFVFMRLIMDPNCMKPAELSQILSEIEGFENSQELLVDFMERQPELKDEALTDIEIFKLWHSLRQECNRFEKSNVTKRSRVNSFQTQLTFKPQINQKSKFYAEKSLKKYLDSNKLHHQKSLALSDIKEQKDPNFYSNTHNELNRYLSNKSNDSQNLPISQTENKQTLIQPSSPSSYHDLLYKRKLQKEQINKKLYYDQQMLDEQLQSRKAPASQVRNIVNGLYYIPEKRSDTNYQKLRQEESLKQCTFWPETKDSYNSYRQQPDARSDAQMKAYNRQIERLKKARQQKQKAKETYDNLGRTKQRALKNIKMPSFIERDTPKLILEVNIGNGYIQKIKLKGDEDARLVAKKFVHKHGLDISMQSVLQELVEENLRNI